MEIDELTLHWLAGLLEGEGSFGLIVSKRRHPLPDITIQMRDEDVIAKVADIFEAKYNRHYPQRYQENGWNPIFSTRVVGKKAVGFMTFLRPLMGSRRQAQIEKAVNGYEERERYRALTPEQVEEIRERAHKGESPFHLAKEYGISKTLAYYIKDGYTYKESNICERSSVVEQLPSKQWVTRSNRAARSLVTALLITSIQIKNLQIEPKDLYWMAGLLEGEGSFIAPSPSAPNTPRISISMTDEDVIARVAALIGVSYQQWQPKNETHKVNYIARLRSNPAAELMRAIYPLMGDRRKAQIDRALENYVYSVKGRGDRSVKLDEEKVREIRRRIDRGESLLRLADKFGVSLKTIRNIMEYKSWKHVTIDDSGE